MTVDKPDSPDTHERWINIRKLAALDIALRGPRLILIDFAAGVFACGGLGVFNLFTYFHSPDHSLYVVILGLALSWISLNYVPLLLYAIDIARRGSARQEVAFELEHKTVYTRKFAPQSLLMLLPLVVPIMAITQEIQRRSNKA